MENPNTLDISIDLETWGKRAGFDVRSIGATLFSPTLNLVGAPVDPIGDTKFTFYRACDNPLTGSYSRDHFTQFDLDCIDGPHRQYNLLRDRKTVEWWDERSDEAKSGFEDPLDLRLVLMDLSQWLKSVGVDPEDEHSARLWSHGAAFDLPFLEEVFHVVDLPVPWHYRAPRDTRTVFDDAGITDHSTWLKKHRVGTFHNALDDAFTQALAINTAKLKINEPRRILESMWHSWALNGELAQSVWINHLNDIKLALGLKNS